MKIISLFVLLFLMINLCFSQNTDEKVIRDIFDNVLTSDVAYNNLEYLCEHAPGRLLGSEESLVAINYMNKYFESLEADTVFFQKFQTPAWKCYNTEVSIQKNNTFLRLRADALGPSSSTPDGGLLAQVIEVQGIEELKNMDIGVVKGKIIFFNRPVDIKLVNTFRVYSSAIDQRYYGPALAAKYGASGVLVRTVGTKIDSFPHTGSTGFKDIKIPCAAISTIDANILSEALKSQKDLQVKMVIDAEEIENITTYNLIADLHGSEFPDEYIVIGGHIDS